MRVASRARLTDALARLLSCGTADPRVQFLLVLIRPPGQIAVVPGPQGLAWTARRVGLSAPVVAELLRALRERSDLVKVSASSTGVERWSGADQLLNALDTLLRGPPPPSGGGAAASHEHLPADCTLRVSPGQLDLPTARAA